MYLRRLCCCCALGLLAPWAAAWAPATHAYLARRITGRSTPGIIYGAMAVDINGSVLDRSLGPKLSSLTHADRNDLEAGDFATGFATHNGQSGTDYYIHLHYNPDAPEIWSTRKIRQFCREFDIAPRIGEGLLDMTVEYLVRLECGPQFGILIAQSAQDSHEHELADAFAEPLAQRAGIPREKAALEIRRAARAFQVLIQTYGNQLAHEEPYLRWLAHRAVVVLTGYDLETAREIFSRALDICRDEYSREMTQICNEVRERMKAIPKYASP